MNERLGRGEISMNLGDAAEVRDLFKGLKKESQESLQAAEEKVIDNILRLDPSFDRNTVRSLVFEMTERDLRKAMSSDSR